MYSPYQKQVDHSILAMNEEKLAQCQPPKCNRQVLFSELFHTFPENIHKEYIDKIEMRSLEKKRRKLDILLRNAENIEVIAYPNRSQFEEEPQLFARTIEPSNSITPLRVRFDPDVLDFGIRY